jgi:hypothetical protein
MNDTDKFMQEEFMPFYKRVLDAFQQNHHTFYAVLNAFLSGKKNHIGMRITAQGNILGDYTIYLDGANVSHLENGLLASEVHTPFGIMRPYVILEKSSVEKMIRDEPDFIKDPFATKLKYAHETTVKFLKD